MIKHKSAWGNLAARHRLMVEIAGSSPVADTTLRQAADRERL
jgi:hypothetical protein